MIPKFTLVHKTFNVVLGLPELLDVGVGASRQQLGDGRQLLEVFVVTLD